MADLGHFPQFLVPCKLGTEYFLEIFAHVPQTKSTLDSYTHIWFFFVVSYLIGKFLFIDPRKITEIFSFNMLSFLSFTFFVHF